MSVRMPRTSSLRMMTTRRLANPTAAIVALAHGVAADLVHHIPAAEPRVTVGNPALPVRIWDVDNALWNAFTEVAALSADDVALSAATRPGPAGCPPGPILGLAYSGEAAGIRGGRLAEPRILG